MKDVKSILGVLFIVLLGLSVFILQLKLGLHEKIFASHVSTSLFVDSNSVLAQSSSPLALFSLNFFAFKLAIKKWIGRSGGK